MQVVLCYFGILSYQFSNIIVIQNIFFFGFSIFILVGISCRVLKSVLISSAIRLPPTGHKETLAGFHVRSEEVTAQKAKIKQRKKDNYSKNKNIHAFTNKHIFIS